MDYTLAYIALCAIVIVVYVAYLHLRVISKLEKIYKKLSGDAQQIKTAQRADKKRDHEILDKIK